MDCCRSAACAVPELVVALDGAHTERKRTEHAARLETMLQEFLKWTASFLSRCW